VVACRCNLFGTVSVDVVIVTVPAITSLNEAPELQQLTLNFWRSLLVVTILNNDGLLVVTVYEVHVYRLFTLPFLV